MQTIRKKLHSNSGASMIMALLLMLVGVVTSAVIIAASLSAALHIKEDRAQQQAYLTVSSAAELIRDQLEAGKSDYTKTETTTTTTYTAYYQDNTTSETPVITMGDENVIFSSIIKSAIEYLDNYEIYEKTYTINAHSENTDYDEVSAKVLMDKTTNNGEKEYRLTIEFIGGEEPNQCRMTLTMKGDFESTSSSSETYGWYNYRYYTSIKTAITTTTVTWKDSSIQRPRIQ